MGDDIKGGFHIQEGKTERFTLVFIFSEDQGAIHLRLVPDKTPLQVTLYLLYDRLYTVP